MKEDSFQSSVASLLINYIALKQALGRRFEDAAAVLLKFDRFLCTTESRDFTAETFGHWCQTLENLSSHSRLGRMRIVRNFCLYRRRTDPGCFVPDRTYFPKARSITQPYIFSEIEVARIITWSDRIPVSVRSPLRRAVTRLAIVLLYTTGLRLGELLRLTPADYDPCARTLMIRESKFHKSRLLPLRADAAGEVETFLKARSMVRPPADLPLLLGPYRCSEAYSVTQLRKNLHILFRMTGIKKLDGRLPRIHDFRFSFAVNALVRWYRDGNDVQAKLPLLATYLGHVSVLSTYYYLRFITPLATLASSAFAAHYGALIQAPAEEGAP